MHLSCGCHGLKTSERHQNSTQQSSKLPLLTACATADNMLLDSGPAQFSCAAMLVALQQGSSCTKNSRKQPAAASCYALGARGFIRPPDVAR
jgi:hypothetical protein